jgi:hypothetical protein
VRRVRGRHGDVGVVGGGFEGARLAFQQAGVLVEKV